MGQFLRVFVAQELHLARERRFIPGGRVSRQLIWHAYRVGEIEPPSDEFHSGEPGEPLRLLSALREQGWTTVSIESAPTAHPAWYSFFLWRE
jgi:hypothetical protein